MTTAVANKAKIDLLIEAGEVTEAQADAWRRRASIIRKERLSAAEFRAKYPEIDDLARPVVAAYTRNRYREKVVEEGGDPASIKPRKAAPEGVTTVRRLRRAGYTMAEIEAEARRPKSQRNLDVSLIDIEEWRSFRAAEARTMPARGRGPVQQAILAVLRSARRDLTPSEIHERITGEDVAYATVVSTLNQLIRGDEALVERIAPAGPTGRFENVPKYRLAGRS